MGRQSKVSPSTKWRLGENLVLQLMECVSWLTPSVSFEIFMNNCFTSFRLLPTLELTTFEQHVCSTKIGYANALSLGTNSCEKRNVAALNNAPQEKSNFDSVWLERRQRDLHSFFWIL